MVDVALQHSIEQFLYREVRLLSERRYEEWLELFTDDARYWMPARETVDGQPDAVAADGEMAFFDDDKTFLARRIERLRSSLAHAEQPPSRMRYFVSNVEVGERDDHLLPADEIKGDGVLVVVVQVLEHVQVRLVPLAEAIVRAGRAKRRTEPQQERAAAFVAINPELHLAVL